MHKVQIILQKLPEFWPLLNPNCMDTITRMEVDESSNFALLNATKFPKHFQEICTHLVYAGLVATKCLENETKQESKRDQKLIPQEPIGKKN